jgi:D-tagatose-1,6-bisphosphate aldolase subunit GatZ/KbaZ
MRHYSLSDRIRYYWADPRAGAAVDRLVAALRGAIVPAPLFWQHMPAAAAFAGHPLDPEALLIWRVSQSLAAYRAATTPRPENRA